MTFINEHEHLADGQARLRLEFADEVLEIIDILATELVDERAEQSRVWLAEFANEFGSRASTLDGNARSVEDTFDLFIEFITVRYDDDARSRISFKNPFREQDHDDALATALSMPDDTALTFLDVLLSGLDAEVLMRSRQLLRACIEEDEVVQQPDEPRFLADLREIFLELWKGVVGSVKRPTENGPSLTSQSPLCIVFKWLSIDNDFHFVPCRLVWRIMNVE